MYDETTLAYAVPRDPKSWMPATWNGIEPPSRVPIHHVRGWIAGRFTRTLYYLENGLDAHLPQPGQVLEIFAVLFGRPFWSVACPPFAQRGFCVPGEHPRQGEGRDILSRKFRNLVMLTTTMVPPAAQHCISLDD